MKTKKAESGRIKLPRGTTANERAKSKIWPGEKDKSHMIRTVTKAVKEARAGLIPSEETDGLNLANNVCQNCCQTWRDDQLAEITHGIWERVSPGELMPSGECPECGALCHPIKNALTEQPEPVIFVEGGLVQAVLVLDSTALKGYREVSYELVDYDVFKNAPDSETVDHWNGFSPALKTYFKKFLKDEYEKFRERGVKA